MLTGPRITAILSTASALTATAISSLNFGFDFLPALGIGGATAFTTYAASKALNLVDLLETFLTRMNTRVLPRAEGSLEGQTVLLRSLSARVDELRHLTQTSRHVEAIGQDIATMSHEFTQIVQRASQLLNGQGEANPDLARNFQEFLQNVNELMGSLNGLLAMFAPPRGLAMPPAMGPNPFAMFGGGAPGANPLAMFAGLGNAGGPAAGGHPLAALFAGFGGADNDSDDENDAAPRDPDAARQNAAAAEARAEAAPEARPAAAPEARPAAAAEARAEAAPEASPAAILEARVAAAQAAAARAAAQAPQNSAAEVAANAPQASVENNAGSNGLNHAPAPVLVRIEAASPAVINAELRRDAPSESTDASVTRRTRKKRG